MQDNEKNQMLFIQLVLTFQTAAWQHMGKVKNPMTDKIERSLPQARFSIDMLDMLRTRTQGNLGDDEKKLLDHTLSELQLNYVAEVEADKQPKPDQGDDGGDGKLKDVPPESATETNKA